MKIFGIGVAVIIALIVLWFIGVGLGIVGQGARIIEKSTDADHVISNYEEFQNMYNSCVKLDGDLKSLRAVPENDPMFAQFSKTAMLTAKKQQITRWVEEYNAKSKMINRNRWKSGELPYQLSTDDFPNYSGPNGGT